MISEISSETQRKLDGLVISHIRAKRNFRIVIVRRLYFSMRTLKVVADTFQLALDTSVCTQPKVLYRPSLLSEVGSTALLPELGNAIPPNASFGRDKKNRQHRQMIECNDECRITTCELHPFDGAKSPRLITSLFHR